MFCLVAKDSIKQQVHARIIETPCTLSIIYCLQVQHHHSRVNIWIFKEQQLVYYYSNVGYLDDLLCIDLYPLEKLHSYYIWIETSPFLVKGTQFRLYNRYYWHLRGGGVLVLSEWLPSTTTKGIHEITIHSFKHLNINVCLSW